MRRRRHEKYAASPVPGAEPPRWRPRVRYELLGCGLHGHELVGTTAAFIRDVDHWFAREWDGLRWHRCLRCDSWLPVSPPARPQLEHVPAPEQVTLPLRGRPLKDRYVLRLIAVDRAIHFVVLALIAAVLFVLALYHQRWHSEFLRIVTDVQGGVGGPTNAPRHGVLGELNKAFSLSTRNLFLFALGVSAYALLEGAEAVGLWRGRRWGEYLTFVANLVFLPLEIWELTGSVSVLKVAALVANVVIVLWLIWRKRLFGVRGGLRAERAEYARDSGWPAVEAATPGVGVLPPALQTSSPSASAASSA